MKPFWKRDPTKKKDQAEQKNVIQMVTTTGEFYYAWNGKLYESDIVRACIRPKVKAIGKLVGKHIREDPKGELKVNPDANIRFLLSEPNPYMTGQQMQEKVANQLCLNNNAFILIVRVNNQLRRFRTPHRSIMKMQICHLIYPTYDAIDSNRSIRFSTGGCVAINELINSRGPPG